MTRPPDPRGANRRGSGWGDDIGYSADATTQTPAPRYVPQQTGPRLTPFVPQHVTFSDGTQAIIVPFTEYGVGRAGSGERVMVTEVQDA